ncbi:MAG: S-layer homology domain-containing protein [Filifactoraceae bacterium]
MKKTYEKNLKAFKQTKKRILSLVLMTLMIVNILPTSAFAVKNKNSFLSSLTVNNPTDTTVINYGGFDWYVIGFDGNGVMSSIGDMTLFAKESIIKEVIFKAGLPSNEYGTSDLKTTIEGIYNGFTPYEKTAVIPRNLAGGSDEEGIEGMSGPDVSDAHLWPLDRAEASTVNITLRKDSGNYGWWLRSPMSTFGGQIKASSVFSSDGTFAPYAGIVGYKLDVRPAFKMDTSHILLASNAVGSKPDTVSSTLPQVVTPSGSQKLTLKDSTLTTGTVSARGTDTNSGTIINVSLTNATPSKTVSAIVVDSAGVIKYYGKIGDTDGSGNTNDLDLNLPVNIDGTNNILKVFVEELNGDNKTDYGSDFATVTIDAAPILTAGSTNRTSDATGTVKFTSNEVGEYYYQVVPSGATPPTVSTTGAGTPVGTTEATINLAGLETGQQDVYVVVKDTAGNVSTAIKITVPAYLAPDTTAPVLTPGATDRTSDATGTVKFTSNEAGEYYYQVVPSGATPPTVSTTGAGTPVGTTEATINLASLATGTQDIYVVVKDTEGNVSAPIKLTLPAYVVPVLYTLSFNLNGGNGYAPNQNISVGSLAKSPENPTMIGYRFVGWNTATNGRGTNWDFYKTAMPAHDVTLYAQWEEKADNIGGGTNNKNNNGNINENVVKLNKDNHISYVIGYPNGSFEPNVYITRGEMVTIFSNLLKEPYDNSKYFVSRYRDIGLNDWYAGRVGYMDKLGIIAGYPDGSFGGENPITRAEFVTMASKFESLSTGGNNPFTDIPAGHWAKAYINSSGNKSWVMGYPDGNFLPEQCITRAEAVTIINNMLERDGDRFYIDSMVSRLINFTDVDKNHWAYYDIYEAANSHDHSKNSGKEVWKIK